MLGLFDVSGEFGGVLEVFLISLYFFLDPIAEHNFLLEAANDLFFARTTKENMFTGKMNKRVKRFSESGILGNAESTEVRNHRHIRISYRKNLELYFIMIFEPILRTPFWNCISEEKRRLIKMMNSTRDRIEDQLNII